MLVAPGRVVAVEENAVWVSTRRQSTCGSCAARRGCGHGILDSAGAGRDHLVRALANAPMPGVGDDVELAFPEHALLAAAARVYLLPLALMVCAALLVQFVGGSQLTIAAGAFIALALGFVMVGISDRAHRDNPQCQAHARPAQSTHDHVSVLVR